MPRSETKVTALASTLRLRLIAFIATALVVALAGVLLWRGGGKPVEMKVEFLGYKTATNSEVHLTAR